MSIDNQLTMLDTQDEINFSEYAVLYDMLIPADNKYRLIDELIDFSFIYDELKDKYCLDNGRKAANPISPIDVLKHRSRTLRNIIKEWDSHYENQMPSSNHNNTLKDELTNCEELIKFVSSDPMLFNNPAFKESINYLEEAIDDVRSHNSISHDKDAKTGHKSAETSFLGYKTHIAMTPERIITAATITTGEKADGKQLPSLLKKTEDNGVKVDTIIGDAAYSGRENLEIANKKEIAVVAKLNPVITQGHKTKTSAMDDMFSYNKDADRYVCPMGVLSAKGHEREYHNNKYHNKTLRYRWSYRKCTICKLRNECIGELASKSIEIRILSDEHKKQIEFQNSCEFRRLSKERYKIEAKNAELKNVHGYRRAESYGLSAMEMQGAMTLFVVNLKRIMKLTGK